MKTELVLVVAVASNGCIGQNNQLPWHIPEDLKHFKAITMGHPVLMGRKTYQSILDQLGKPLPNRHHYVLTRRADWQARRRFSRKDTNMGLMESVVLLAFVAAGIAAMLANK